MSDVDTIRDSKPDSDSMTRRPVEPLDDVEVRSILRRAMYVDRRKPIDMLPAVQRKIRQRSRGKFYADGWSTGASPSSTYIVTSLLMLAVLAMIYLMLVPGGLGSP